MCSSDHGGMMLSLLVHLLAASPASIPRALPAARLQAHAGRDHSLQGEPGREE